MSLISCCENCSQSPNYSVQINGEVKDLCEQCQPLSKLKSVIFEIPLKNPVEVCPICSTSRESVSDTGLVGCPVCYELFADNIKRLLVN